MPVGLTGETLAGSLNSSGLPVKDVVVFNADTDPNHLLGRPNQYTAKVSWHDSRVEPADDLSQATAEVFANGTDLDARSKLAEAASKAGAGFAQYIYRNDQRLVLLRLPHELTPDQAKQYEDWLKTV